MRVAPIGLYFPEEFGFEITDMLGADVAALTHGHELGYIPAAAFVHIINIISHQQKVDLLYAVNDAMSAVKHLFSNASYLNDFFELIEKACKLSEDMDLDDLEGIRALGAGWVAEETLAIAVYCSLKYQNNFEKGIIAAVNHSGDSDSTGSVTGNILGALLGESAIPEKFLEKLELRDVIIEIADDLYYDYQIHSSCESEGSVWSHKYILYDYKLID